MIKIYMPNKSMHRRRTTGPAISDVSDLMNGNDFLAANNLHGSAVALVSATWTSKGWKVSLKVDSEAISYAFKFHKIWFVLLTGHAGSPSESRIDRITVSEPLAEMSADLNLPDGCYCYRINMLSGAGMMVLASRLKIISSPLTSH